MVALLDSPACISQGLRVVRLHADSNVSGTISILLANGTSGTARLPGDSVVGWTLRGFLTSTDIPTGPVKHKPG